MPIGVVCPSCAAKMRAPDSLAGRKTKCPKCGTALVVPRPGAEHPQRSNPQPLPQSVKGAEPTPVPVMLAPESAPPLAKDLAAATDESPPNSRGRSLSASAPGPVPAIQELDMHTKIAALAAVLGLVVMAISPLF